MHASGGTGQGHAKCQIGRQKIVEERHGDCLENLAAGKRQRAGNGGVIDPRPGRAVNRGITGGKGSSGIADPLDINEAGAVGLAQIIGGIDERDAEIIVDDGDGGVRRINQHRAAGGIGQQHRESHRALHKIIGHQRHKDGLDGFVIEKG